MSFFVCEAVRLPRWLLDFQGYWRCLGEFGAGLDPRRWTKGTTPWTAEPGLRLLLAGHTPQGLQPYRHAWPRFHSLPDLGILPGLAKNRFEVVQESRAPS